MKNLSIQSIRYFLRSLPARFTRYINFGRPDIKSGLKRSCRSCITGFIFLYQQVLSPDHGLGREILGNSRCRFFPSCSEYTLNALSQYGLLQGGVVSLKRIVRCGPWNKGGYDPVK